MPKINHTINALDMAHRGLMALLQHPTKEVQEEVVRTLNLEGVSVAYIWLILCCERGDPQVKP